MTSCPSCGNSLQADGVSCPYNGKRCPGLPLLLFESFFCLIFFLFLTNSTIQNLVQGDLTREQTVFTFIFPALTIIISSIALTLARSENLSVEAIDRAAQSVRINTALIILASIILLSQIISAIMFSTISSSSDWQSIARTLQVIAAVIAFGFALFVLLLALALLRFPPLSGSSNVIYRVLAIPTAIFQFILVIFYFLEAIAILAQDTAYINWFVDLFGSRAVGNMWFFTTHLIVTALLSLFVLLARSESPMQSHSL